MMPHNTLIQRVIWVFCFALSGVTATSAQTEPEPEGADPVMEQVLKAEQAFEQSVAKAKEKLTTDIKRVIDRAIDRAADRGDLDVMERLQNEFKAFQEDGTIPNDKTAENFAEQYNKQLTRVGNRLITQYESALRRYTQQRDIENARLIQEKIKWVRPTTGLDVVERRGQLYLLVTGEAITWTKAKSACESLGGYLACLNSDDEHKFIRDYIIETQRVNVWVGATDSGNEGEWRWLDGSDSYWPWNRNQPDNHHGTQHYGMLWVKNYLLDDAQDDNSVRGYLCEWDGPPTRDTVYRPEAD